MWTWILSLFLPSSFRLDEAVYGFNDTDIEHLADVLATTFGIRFYTYQNPVLGSWCSTVPVSSKDGASDATSGVDATQPTYIIIQNASDLRIPAAGDYVLMVTALAQEINDIREKLVNSGLNFREITYKR